MANNCSHVKIANSREFCSVCPLGPQHRVFAPPSQSTSTHPLELVFFDVWDPTPVLFIEEYMYYILFEDDNFRFSWIYPLKLKSKVEHTFLKFKTVIENLFQRQLKVFQSDWGGKC